MCHVAAEMERQGFDVPLLIGGATTSRVHTAVKIHPNYRRGQALYVNDASRAVGVVAALLSREARSRTIGEVRAEYARIAAAHARGEASKQRLSLDDARANALRLDWSGNYAAAGAAPSRHAALRRNPACRADRLYRLVAVLRRLGAERQISGDPRRQQGRRSRAGSVRRRAGNAAPDGGRALVLRRRRDRLVAGQRRRRRHSGLRRRGAASADRDAAHAAPAACPPRGPRQSRAGRFRRAAGERLARLYRRVCGHRRARRGGGGRALQARQRRLFRDHGQGAGGSFGGSARRAHAPARAPRILGLCARRDARHRRADRGKLSRHPPGARLSGATRPHREENAVRAARRRARHRRQAHRKLRHVAGRLGVRALFQSSGKPLLRRRQDRARPGRRLRQAQRLHARRSGKVAGADLNYDPLALAQSAAE